MITKQEIANWIAKTLNKCKNDDADDGIVYYINCYTDTCDRLFLVATRDEEGVVCKIAYNCDDLQCDYELDWNVPLWKDTGDCALCEIHLSESSCAADAEYFFKELAVMEEYIKHNELVCYF